MEAPRSEETQPVGRLHLFSSDRGPEKDFLLYPGQNMIGRRPDCTVILPFPSISEVHAVIEIPAEGRAPFLRDCCSINGTYTDVPRRRLSPGMDHQLSDKDVILFADLRCQFHSLGAPPLQDPKGAKEVEEIPSAPVIGEPQLQDTSLAKDSQEEGDHGVRAFLPGTASDLQPGSPEKATSSRSQATDNPNTEIKGQSVQSDMHNQDEQDSPDVIFVSSKAPGSEAPAPAWSPRQTRSQKKRTSKRVHSSASPDTQESSSLRRGRGIKRARAEKPAPQATGSQIERAGGIPGSTWKFQPTVQIQRLTVVTKEPSPCPKEEDREQPQKPAAREEEEDKPVEVETAVKTPKGGAELTIQPQEEVKGMPHQSVGQPSLDEEVRALPSGGEIPRRSGTFQPTAQEEAQKEQAGKAPDDNKAESVPEASD